MDWSTVPRPIKVNDSRYDNLYHDLATQYVRRFFRSSVARKPILWWQFGNHFAIPQRFTLAMPCEIVGTRLAAPIPAVALGLKTRGPMFLAIPCDGDTIRQIFDVDHSAFNEGTLFPVSLWVTSRNTEAVQASFLKSFYDELFR